jgi:CopG family nickel-responsive transcriptional regulator
MSNSNNDKTQRISVSLPVQLTEELDKMVMNGGYRNRSQAMAQMIRNTLLDHYEQSGNRIMAGTITLIYDEAQADLKTRLTAIQRHHIDSVISGLNVLLEKDYSLEVLLVQGPVDTLNKIVKEIRACKGVENCKLVLSSALMPPIHRKTGANND